MLSSIKYVETINLKMHISWTFYVYTYEFIYFEKPYICCSTLQREVGNTP